VVERQHSSEDDRGMVSFLAPAQPSIVKPREVGRPSGELELVLSRKLKPTARTHADVVASMQAANAPPPQVTQHASNCIHLALDSPTKINRDHFFVD
jgi:hypothetical protein